VASKKSEGEKEPTEPRLGSADTAVGSGYAPTLATPESGNEDTLAATDENAENIDGEYFHETLPASDRQSDDLDTFRVVDRSEYNIGEELARGGMGRIFHARDRRHSRPVAIKELLTDTPTLKARFRREALITARLQHPAIVPVYEAGRWPKGEPFYAMKMVEGKPLDKVIAEKKTLKERISLLPNVTAVADALAYAHDKRIIHRDLKPANILFGDFGETVVIDWGLAKDLNAAEVSAAPMSTSSLAPENDHLPAGPSALEATLTVAPSEVPDGVVPASEDGLTVAGHAMGTPAYMPPEQARGEQADERSDVYAIGTVLYHVLSGDAPYHDSASVEELLASLLDGPPRALAEIDPSVPADLLAIVDRAMAREPSERYATAAELAKELRRFQDGQLVGAHQYSTAELIGRWVRRHKSVVIVTALLLTTLAGVALVSVRAILNEREQTASERDIATEQRLIAEENFSDLLEELGRSELVNGSPDRAASYLSEAYLRGRDSAAMRTLLAAALREIEARKFTLTGHHGTVSAAVSPDGSHIVTAGYSKESRSLRLWKTTTGELVRTMASQEYGWLPAYSPAGTHIVVHHSSSVVLLTASGAPYANFSGGLSAFLGSDAIAVTSADEVTLWNVGTKERVWSVQVPEHMANRASGTMLVAARQDGALLAVSGDRVVQVRDAQDGHLLRELVHDGRVSRLEFVSASRDLATLEMQYSEPDGPASGSYVYSVTLWDVDAGMPRVRIAHEKPGNIGGAALAISQDGTQFATGVGRQLKIWRASDGAQIVSIEAHGGDIKSVAFSPDGKRVATGGDDNVVRVWDTTSGIAVAAFKGHAGSVTGMEFTGDGDVLVTTSEDGTAAVWDVGRARHRHTFAVQANGRAGGGFSADGDIVGVADGQIRIWDPPSGRAIRSFGKDVEQAYVSDTGTDVLAIHGDWKARTFQVYRISDGALLMTLGPTDRGASFVRDTNLVAQFREGGVDLFDRATGKLESSFEDEGARLYVHQEYLAAMDSGHVRLYNIDTHQLVADLNPNAINIWFDKDGRRLFTEPLGLDRHLVEVWDISSKERIAELSGHLDFVDDFVLDPDERRAVTTSRDSVVRVWDLDTARLVASLEGHAGPVSGALWSPDGTRIVTIADKIRVWDANSGRLLDQFQASAGDLKATWAAFSRDGAQLLTMGGTLALWDMSVETRAAEAVRSVVDERGRWKLEGASLAPARQAPHAP
jgi:WD40 repeat protein/serine/threonine protein kinase